LIFLFHSSRKINIIILRFINIIWYIFYIWYSSK
jgi:hypothetical protein